MEVVGAITTIVGFVWSFFSKDKKEEEWVIQREC
jgi:hypothetical protein